VPDDAGSWQYVTWLIHVCDMTHACLHWCVWYDSGTHSFKCVVWLMHALIEVQDDAGSWQCVTWLYVTHSWVWHDHTCPSRSANRSDSWHYVTWRTHTGDIFHACPLEEPEDAGSWRHVTWLTHVCDMTHACPYRDARWCWFVTCCIYVMGMTRSYIFNVTHSYVWHDSNVSALL